MRRGTVLAALACLLAAPAAAQDATQTAPPPVPVTSAPLAPLGGPAAPAMPATPGAPAAGVPQAETPQAETPQRGAPATPQPGTAQNGAPAQTFTPAPAAPQVWLPRGTAELQALDKVDATTKILSVKVGETTTFGSLTIAVQACVVTPPDEARDAAAFLVITDSHSSEPGFSGWMIADAPSVSMLQNPIYDVRVTGCGA